MSGLGLASRRKGNAGPVKKMVIKPFKEKPKLPDNFYENTWQRLSLAIDAVHHQEAVSFSQEELYRSVEDLCLHKMADKLYAQLEATCDRHILALVESLKGQTEDTASFLGIVDTCWSTYCQQMATIRSIFLYLDRTYVIQNSTVRSLWDMGLGLFRKHLTPCSEVITKLSNGILKLIEAERNGDMVDRALLKSLLRMYSSLQIYTELFEVPFLAASNHFYGAEGQRYMQQAEVSAYLRHVEQRIHEENLRVQHYLDAATRRDLIRAVEIELLERHLDAILDKGFMNLMDEHRVEDLGRCYSLFARVQGLYALKAAFNTYVKKTGLEKVMDTEKDDNLVQDLLDYKAKLDEVLLTAFQGTEEFSHSLKEAFEHFINSRQNKPAELVARYIDGKLRSGVAGVTDDELEEVLDKVMVVFRFIQGKDVFEAFYKKKLAKRLLLGKSASEDAEKAMISKLKQECGSAFTIKLEGMFKDMDLSADVMTAYKESAGDSEHREIELSVRVLTMGSWPPYPTIKVQLPEQVKTLQDDFFTFYTKRHSGRTLTWQNSLGQSLLKANFPAGKRELQVSLFQAVVLLLFNNHDTLSFTEIATSTEIEQDELKRTLQSLSNSKNKILRKGSDDDNYTYNSKFTAKYRKIKVDSIQVKETPQESTETHAKVFQDRQYQVDAAVVRILKARKSLSHTLLVADIYSQLKFPMKPVDIKKRIESLIDREYIERDKSNPQVYLYNP